MELIGASLGAMQLAEDRLLFQGAMLGSDLSKIDANRSGSLRPSSRELRLSAPICDGRGLSSSSSGGSNSSIYFSKESYNFV